MKTTNDENNKFMRVIAFVLLLMASPFLGICQQGFPERTKLALKSGDSQKLGRICATKVEFGLEGDAQEILGSEVAGKLAGFFRENPPVDASVLFQGKSKDGRKYLICRLNCKNGGVFRFSFYWKEAQVEALEVIDISRE